MKGDLLSPGLAWSSGLCRVHIGLITAIEKAVQPEQAISVCGIYPLSQIVTVEVLRTRYYELDFCTKVMSFLFLFLHVMPRYRTCKVMPAGASKHVALTAGVSIDLGPRKLRVWDIYFNVDLAAGEAKARGVIDYGLATLRR